MWCCASSSPAAHPGGLSADRAAKLLRSVRPDGSPPRSNASASPLELLADVRRLDRDIAAAQAPHHATPSTRPGTTLLELHGVGPIVAAFILGHVGDPARFPTPDRFASYNGTAPIEASSGPRKRHRLNPRGNRKLNHAMHLIAVTQIRHDTPGRAYYQRKTRRGQDRRRKRCAR